MTIIEDFGAWYTAEPTYPVVDFEKFLAWARVHQHPSWKPERWDVYRLLVEQVAAAPNAGTSIIERFRELDYATQIRAAADSVLAKGGSAGLADIEGLASEYRERNSASSIVSGTSTPELGDMLEGLVRSGGVDWRLEDLNRSIGPLHRGDLILVGARPEVGKTTFLTHEFTHMVKMLPPDQHAVIFNNEEIANKLRVRLVQSELSATVADLLMDPSAAQAEYLDQLDGRRIDVIHDTAMTTKDVERILKPGKYGLIGFNILDKIVGFHKLEEVQRLRALGVWARGLADKYGVVFALAQADATAEGQRLLTQAQLYGTKTGLVAESDAMLMIGKDNSPGMAERRWINVVRNKMPGGPRTTPANRHGVFEVAFDGERASFSTLAYKGAAP